MRHVAAIYDIHGNLPALAAVLEEVRREDVDLIVVGGDVVPGPMPRETLDCLFDVDLPIRFIKGNGEVAVLTESAGGKPRVPEQVRETIRWNARQLSQQQIESISGWPMTCKIDIGTFGEVLFCHATPRNENDIFTRETPAEKLMPIFDEAGAALVVCGHTHMQFDRTIGKTRVVNAGSVGMPFGEPGAYWLLLGENGDVDLRRTRYDLEHAAQRIRATEYPQASEFAEGNVLHPPTEADMLARVRPASL